MRSTSCGRFSARIAGAASALIGVLLMTLGTLQTSGGLEGYALTSHTLTAKDSIKVRVDGGPNHAVQAFSRAVRDWDRAVSEFNYAKDFECNLKILLGGCRACIRERRLPRIEIVENWEYDVAVEFRDSMPGENIVAYTERYPNGSLPARIVMWSGIPEHVAYQAAMREISRLYGIDIHNVYRTLFGAIPAGTREPNPNMGRSMDGAPGSMKPTTLDLHIAYEGLKNPEGGRVYVPRMVFRAYDEPDFTIPALASPIMVTAGLYFLSKRGGRGGQVAA